MVGPPNNEKIVILAPPLCPVNLQCTLSFRQVGLNLRPVHLLTRLIIMRIICLDLAPKSDLISVVRFVSEDSFFINFLIILHD